MTKVEVHDKRALLAKRTQLQRRLHRLQQTRIRVRQQGGRGWTLEISSTNVEVIRVLDELHRIANLLRRPF